MNIGSVSGPFAAVLLCAVSTALQVDALPPLHVGFTKDGFAGTLAGVPSWCWPDQIGYCGLLLDRSAFGLTGEVQHVRVKQAITGRRSSRNRGADAKDVLEQPREPLYEVWFDSKGRVGKLRTWTHSFSKPEPKSEFVYVWEGAELKRIDVGGFDFKDPTQEFVTRYDTKGRMIEVIHNAIEIGASREYGREQLVLVNDELAEHITIRPNIKRVEKISRRGDTGFHLEYGPDRYMSTPSSRDIDGGGRIVQSQVDTQPVSSFTFDSSNRLATMSIGTATTMKWKRIDGDAETSFVEDYWENFGTTFVYTETTARDAAGNAIFMNVEVDWRGNEKPGDAPYPVIPHRIYWTIEYFKKADGTDSVK